MIILLEIFLHILLINVTSAFDPFEGLLKQGRPCFETIHGEGCNTQLSEVFSPPYKGSNINAMNSQLYLFTETNPDKGEPLHECGGKLPKNTAFNPHYNTTVISHGWLDGMCRSAWMREIKDQLLERGKFNVILAGYTWGNLPDPIEASVSADVAGEDIAFTVMNIMKQTNMTNGDRFHFIGHSYGAFAMNTAARYIVERKPKHKIRRISLLDPGIAPLRYNDPYLKINSENTKFMDVIHTDTGTCAPFNFGILPPVGHVDFYPNGGGFQLSCYSYIITSLEKGDFLYALGSLVYPPLCSHLQSIQYFKVSINHPQGLFIGAECKNYEEFELGICHRCCEEDFSKCAVMGMDAEDYFSGLHQPRANRTYFLNLGLTCPYNEDYNFSIYRDCKKKAMRTQCNKRKAMKNSNAILNAK